MRRKPAYINNKQKNSAPCQIACNIPPVVRVYKRIPGKIPRVVYTQTGPRPTSHGLLFKTKRIENAWKNWCGFGVPKPRLLFQNHGLSYQNHWLSIQNHGQSFEKPWPVVPEPRSVIPEPRSVVPTPQILVAEPQFVLEPRFGKQNKN